LTLVPISRLRAIEWLETLSIHPYVAGVKPQKMFFVEECPACGGKRITRHFIPGEKVTTREWHRRGCWLREIVANYPEEMSIALSLEQLQKIEWLYLGRHMPQGRERWTGHETWRCPACGGAKSLFYPWGKKATPYWGKGGHRVPCWIVDAIRESRAIP
jgi:rubredoxin